MGVEEGEERKGSGLRERREEREQKVVVVVVGKRRRILTDDPPGSAVEFDGRADLEVVRGHRAGVDDEARLAEGGDPLSRRRGEDLS